MFCAGVEERNKAIPSDPVPDGLVACHDASTVSKYLCYFVQEIRAANKSKYSLTMIQSILSALNRIYKESKAPFTILEGQIGLKKTVTFGPSSSNIASSFLAASGEGKSSMSDNQQSGTKFGSSSSICSDYKPVKVPSMLVLYKLKTLKLCYNYYACIDV